MWLDVFATAMVWAASSSAFVEQAALFQRGIESLEAGKYDSAERQFRAVLQARQVSHDLTAAAASNLGAVYFDRGRFPEAEKQYRLAIRTWEEHGSVTDARFVRSLVSLAALYLSLERPSPAEPLLMRAKRLTELPNSSSRERATVLTNLAVLHRFNREPLLAADELGQALQLLAGQPDRVYSDLARVHSSLCVLKAEMRQFSEAVPHCTAARELWERHLGPDHPWVADALRNLAALAYLQRDFAHAQALLSRAVDIVQHSLGPQHYRVGEMLMMQAAVSRASGDSKNARALEQRAKAILAGHPATSPHTIDWLALRH